MIFIGLDIGSTAVKAMALNHKGEVVARGKCAYPTNFADPYVTQRAEDWWSSAVVAVRHITDTLDSAERVVAISTSSQGGSMLALDGEYKPLTDAMTWMDRRGEKQSGRVIAHFGNDTVYRKFGWRPTPIDCVSKLLWLRENAPDVFAKAAHYMTTEEYVNYRLCGENVTDPTGAAIMRLYNINDNRWDAEMLDYVGVEESKLPRVVPIGTLIGKLTPAAAAELGLDTSVSVYCGAHDQYCASIGSGITRPGDILLATGTAWVMFGVTDRLCFNSCYIAPGIHAMPGVFGAMATLSGVGAAVANHAEAMGAHLKDVDAIAATRRKSAADLLCCPCPPGRSFLEHKPGTLGGTWGKTESHDGYDVALALMEGAAFEVKMSLEKFSEAGMMSSPVLTMSGGAAASELWRGIVGQVTGRDVLLTTEKDTPALGAGMIAATYGGAYESLADCSAAFVRKLLAEHVYDAEAAEHYARKLELYRKWCIV